LRLVAAMFSRTVDPGATCETSLSYVWAPPSDPSIRGIQCIKLMALYWGLRVSQMPPPASGDFRCDLRRQRWKFARCGAYLSTLPTRIPDRSRPSATVYATQQRYARCSDVRSVPCFGLPLMLYCYVRRVRLPTFFPCAGALGRALVSAESVREHCDLRPDSVHLAVKAPGPRLSLYVLPCGRASAGKSYVAAGAADAGWTEPLPLLSAGSFSSSHLNIHNIT